MTRPQWQTVVKPAFLQGLQKLPGKDVLQIMEKVSLLAENPLPDGDIKKQLTHCTGKPHRIRSGDYRIFYTFNQETVCVYKVDRRHEGTYKHCPEAEFAAEGAALAGLEMPEEGVAASMTLLKEEWLRPVEEKRPFPEALTSQILRELKIPERYHARLLRITNEADLLTCPGVEDEWLLALDTYMFEKPLEQVMMQPDFILKDIDDLLRYREGELISFLLKLSPEQEKYTRWSLDAQGPALVKGGPGTGKSTVALYRVRSLLEQLPKNGKGALRVLFTTYTNALVRASEQQLQQLLGTQAWLVQVNTADKLADLILREKHAALELLEGDELRHLTKRAVEETRFSGSVLQQAAQRQTIERMGLEYLLQELTGVIVARQLRELADYQSTSRAGRQLRLNALQRQAVWLVYESWCRLLAKVQRETWQQRRARACELAEQSSLARSFDAVVIDEAQDLDPAALRMLVKLSKASNRIFITADANQSIYGSGFRWQDVHVDLKFHGRTSVLRANYRSTEEIGEAAQTYLANGMLEEEQEPREYVNEGPLPDARSVGSFQHEIALLASYFRKASQILRLTPGSCAVLCPNRSVAQAIASELSQTGLDATFMEGRELNLTRPGIKVLTLSSAKGLEFPIVALAGFVTSTYPVLPRGATEDEVAEITRRERRVMYVGMTRAMRALLVVVPQGSQNELLAGFDPTRWNFNRAI